MAEQPQRAHTLILSFGADTKQDLIAALNALVWRIRKGDLHEGVTGGPSYSGCYSYRHDPAMTHDAYFVALDDYLKTQGTGGDQKSD